MKKTNSDEVRFFGIPKLFPYIKPYKWEASKSDNPIDCVRLD